VSARSLVRNDEGVLLRYNVDAPLPAQRKVQPSDAERMALLKAEGELLALSIIAEHLDISDIAIVRIADALDTIRSALDVRRSRLGMQSLEAV
jgi:hypothetical protein